MGRAYWMACYEARPDPKAQYLAWAWVEAANFALRFSPPIRRWYDRKAAKRHKVIAIKAVAHKLARAGYYLMRDGGQLVNTFSEG